jgi:hypothetical protein
VVLWIGHDDDHARVVVMPFTGGSTSKTDHRRHGLIDVVDGDVEVNSHLADRGLGHWLKHQSRLRVTPLAEMDPALLRRPGLATQQGAPEPGHPFGIEAVDRHTGPHVRHRPILAYRRIPFARENVRGAPGG